MPLTQRKKSFFKDPTVAAIVLGIIAGLICLHLPEGLNSFIVEDLAPPVQSLLLGVISGIMGPYIFISMTTSIISMKSISELTDLGWKIFKRFVMIIFFFIVVSLCVSAFFFNSFGNSSMSFSPDQMIEMVLNIIPTNMLSPFVDNNTSQLVVLGILLGAALLLLDDKTSSLNELLTQLDKWLVSAMNIVLKVIPVVPFFSLLIMIGSGNISSIIKGWKWITAVYIASTIVIAVKAIKTSILTGINIPDFRRKIWPLVKTAFITSSNAAPLKQMYEVSEEELGIDPEFTSFWIPMCSSLLGAKISVYLITATLMTAEMSGMALTNSFMFVLILVTMELSLASPGSASAWTTMFTVLGLSTNYVGLFTALRVLTENYCIGVVEAYDMFEQYEAAWKLGCIRPADFWLRRQR